MGAFTHLSGCLYTPRPYKFIGFGAKPYKFIGFGAMDVTKPYQFIGFGALDVNKPYKFIGFGAVGPGSIGPTITLTLPFSAVIASGPVGGAAGGICPMPANGLRACEQVITYLASGHDTKNTQNILMYIYTRSA